MIKIKVTRWVDRYSIVVFQMEFGSYENLLSESELSVIFKELMTRFKKIIQNSFLK